LALLAKGFVSISATKPFAFYRIERLSERGRTNGLQRLPAFKIITAIGVATVMIVIVLPANLKPPENYRRDLSQIDRRFDRRMKPKRTKL